MNANICAQQNLTQYIWTSQDNAENCIKLKHRVHEMQTTNFSFYDVMLKMIESQ